MSAAGGRAKSGAARGLLRRTGRASGGVRREDRAGRRERGAPPRGDLLQAVAAGKLPPLVRYPTGAVFFWRVSGPSD
jgi:hypothetical protein